MLVRVSPTQIATWQLCPRKWAYSRSRPRTQNRYAAFGERVHAILEAWLKLGTPPDQDTAEGRCATAGLHLLPMPPQAGVETAFEFVFDDVIYNGKRDLVSAYVFGLCVLLTDHKSTGDLKWAKTSAELHDDAQWIVYGTALTFELRLEYVLGQWVYYQRKPPKAIDSTLVDTVAELHRRFARQHARDVVPLAASARRQPPAGFLRELWIDSHPRCYNAGARDSGCGAFGGCPHAHECLATLDPIERMNAALAASQ